LIVILAVICLIILLALVIIYGFIRITKFYKKLKQVATKKEEAEIYKIFKLINANFKTQLKILNKMRNKRGLIANNSKTNRELRIASAEAQKLADKLKWFQDE